MAVYDPRGGENVHIDRILSTISVGYPNNGRVGDRLFPTVKVRKQSDLYYEFGQEHWMPEDEYRAPGDVAIEIPGLTVSTDSYFAKEYALSIAVTDEERQNADSPMDPDKDGTMLVTEKLLLKREFRIQTIVRTAANYPAAQTTTLAGTAQWNDITSDPIGVFKTAKRAIHASLFMEPNLGVIPWEVMSYLEDHPDFIERIKYTSPESVSQKLIASLIGIGELLVPGLGYDPSTPPADPTAITYMWGKDVFIGWVPRSAGMKRPAFGYEFVWRYPNGQTQEATRWREANRKSDVVRVARRYDLKLIAVNGSGETRAGYLIKDAIA